MHDLTLLGIAAMWLCRGERSRAVTTVFGSLDVGSAVGLMLCPPLISNFGWPSVFWVFAIMGLVWSLFWPRLRPEDPDPRMAPPPPPSGGPLCLQGQSCACQYCTAFETYARDARHSWTASAILHAGDCKDLQPGFQSMTGRAGQTSRSLEILLSSAAWTCCTCASVACIWSLNGHTPAC